MPIESICPGCGRRLRVEPQHAGQQARCPMCNAILTMPEQAAPPQKSEDDATWRMKTPEGHVYGPVSKQQLDGWVAEGRISADCRLQNGDVNPWMGAEHVFPILIEKAVPVRHVAPSAPPPSAATARPAGRRVAPHRGALILALGILSWLSCPIFGVLAWILGNGDLREIRAGRMDPEGASMTQAGQILGMIHVLLCLLALVGVVFLVLLGIATS